MVHRPGRLRLVFAPGLGSTTWSLRHCPLDGYLERPPSPPGAPSRIGSSAVTVVRHDNFGWGGSDDLSVVQFTDVPCWKTTQACRFLYTTDEHGSATVRWVVIAIPRPSLNPRAESGTPNLKECSGQMLLHQGGTPSFRTATTTSTPLSSMRWMV